MRFDEVMNDIEAPNTNYIQKIFSLGQNLLYNP